MSETPPAAPRERSGVPATDSSRTGRAGTSRAAPLAWLPALSPDGWLLFATCGVRGCAYGFLSVVLALYLAAIGLDAVAIGAIFTAALAGGAIMTIALTAVADRLGRRRVLVVGALLMALAGAVFALTDIALLLGLAAVIGTISPSGKEVGPFLSVEQAVLPQTTDDTHRTSVFAAYNLVGSLAGALGSLAAGVPDLLGVEPFAGYRALVWAYAAAALALAVLFSRLSPAVEAAAGATAPPQATSSSAGAATEMGPPVRGTVAKLTALFALDAFAGGFVVQGLMAYWFHLRYGLDPAALAALFFATSLLNSLSYLAAVPLARRMGLLNTMVFTHLPSNVLLALVPLVPGLPLAIGVLLARNLLSQLDVPTRQSYTMAIIPPGERAAAAGVLSVARNAAAAAAPALAGATLAVPALGLPFLLAGGLKIVYDLTIWSVFRQVRPPEETAQLAAKG
ncbi:MAG TPA: MFS transporter [Chloroflexota bacterium]|nr:MFS transporter [Chloroflexota bacterium]